MTDKEINLLVQNLAPKERKVAKARVTQALKFGWSLIAIWCDEGFKAHPRDIVGVSPLGDFDFIPDLDDSDDAFAGEAP